MTEERARHLNEVGLHKIEQQIEHEKARSLMLSEGGTGLGKVKALMSTVSKNFSLNLAVFDNNFHVSLTYER